MGSWRHIIDLSEASQGHDLLCFFFSGLSRGGVVAWEPGVLKLKIVWPVMSFQIHCIVFNRRSPFYFCSVSLSTSPCSLQISCRVKPNWTTALLTGPEFYLQPSSFCWRGSSEACCNFSPHLFGISHKVRWWNTGSVQKPKFYRQPILYEGNMVVHGNMWELIWELCDTWEGEIDFCDFVLTTLPWFNQSNSSYIASSSSRSHFISKTLFIPILSVPPSASLPSCLLGLLFQHPEWTLKANFVEGASRLETWSRVAKVSDEQK